MEDNPQSARAPVRGGLGQTLGGLCALAVVMGIGRFAYTALLPGMMAQHGMDAHLAGNLAAWNLAGYLAGVVAVRRVTPGVRRYVLFAVFLGASLASTAGMGLVRGAAAWQGLRFLGGFASGACFVLCSAIVLDTLLAIGRPVLAGLLYSGVGVGIAGGGLAAPALEAWVGADGAWIGMALLGVLPAGAALAGLRPGVNRVPAPAPHPAAAAAGTPAPARDFAVLLAAYSLEGFGYIIGTTFLVALVRDTTHSPELAGLSWVLTGCAAAVSAPLWRLAARRGLVPLLILAFTLQGAGVLLPALSSAPLSVLAGGLLLGGTFMGITVLSLQHGVAISGRPSAHAVAVLTAGYGLGQILGPFLSGMLAREQDFTPAFVMAAAGLFLAAALLAAGHLTQRPARAAATP